MYMAILTSFRILTVLAIIVALRFGYFAVTESDCPRKGQARLIATLIFGGWFCVAPLLLFISDKCLPIFEFKGTIESVRVVSSNSRHFSAYLRIKTNMGGWIDVHATDRSNRFQPGQHLQVRYRGDTGELISAEFFSPAAIQDGELHSTKTMEEVICFLLGIFLIWVAFRVYHRDPQGSEV